MRGDVESYGERAWRMLLEELVVRQLFRVGVRRDAVELDQVDPRHVVPMRGDAAHAAAGRRPARAGREHGEHRARVHDGDAAVALERARLRVEACAQLARVLLREEDRLAEDDLRTQGCSLRTQGGSLRTQGCSLRG